MKNYNGVRLNIMFEFIKGLSAEQLFSSTVSTIAILSGAIIGAACSYIISKNSIRRTEKIQEKIFEDRIKFEEKNRIKNICDHARVISLDICTAIFQSIRSLRNFEKGDFKDLYPVPVNSQYSMAIAELNNFMNLKELSYIYQLYGIIEKLNHDIKSCSYKDKESYELIKMDYESLIRKLYGDNSHEILKLDIDNATYEDMYNNNLIKDGYKNVLGKLEQVCRGCTNII